MPSASLSLGLLAFGMDETFVRPETGGVGGKRKIRKENALEMGLKDGEHSTWSEKQEQKSPEQDIWGCVRCDRVSVCRHSAYGVK